MSANYGGQRNVCCGLVCKGKRPIPLISVDVRATVIHAVAQVEITQSYENTGEHPIEAIYYFPVDPEGAVTNFQAELDGRVIKGIVKEREEAVKEYVDAIIDGMTTFLGEETKTDIFKLRVGFLKPGAHVKVIIEYITEVKNEPGTNNIRFYIPTTIAPRYVSPTETDSQAIEIKNMSFSTSSPAPLSIKATVSIHGGIKAIKSPTHEVSVQKIESTSDDDNYHTAVVELSGKTTDMDRDFVLTIEPEEKHKPRMYSEANGNSTAVMVHLLPSFKLCDLKTELIFVLDRSGSMEGKSIALAKKALLLFLHSMPADCYFNIFGFGSSYTSVFRTSVKYDDESLKKAKAHARDLDADLGGTEILAPIKKIASQPGIDGYLRQIFILTDGEVSGTDAIFQILRANAHKMRVFALGIGDGASHGSITGIAKAGCGTAAYVTYNESMDEKVLNQLKNALQPCLTEIHLEWEGLTSEKPIPVLNKMKTLLGYNKPIETDDELTSDSCPRVEQSPETIPPVFDGSQLLVFGLFRNDCPKAVLITAKSPDGPLSARVELSPSSNLDGNKSLLLHRLAAIKLIRELEDKEDCEPRNNLKQQIVDLACHNGITSRYTSFIAHDISSGEQKLMKDNWVMETRYVPNQLAHGWHGSQSWGRLSPSDIQTDSISDAYYDIMKTNVERVLERDAKLSELDDRADGLCAGAPQNENVTLFSSLHLRRLINPAPPHASHKENGFSFSRLMQLIKPTPAAPDKENGFSSSGLMQLINPTPPGSHKENEFSSSRLMQLINLQSYDGSFTLNNELAQILGKSLAEMLAASNKYNLSNQVFATALAISFFVNNLADEKEKWDLIVTKAKKWLNSAVQPENVDATVELASEFLKRQ